MKNAKLFALKTTAAMATALVLVACGGGGGSSTPPVIVSPPPPPPPPTGPSWTPGVFQAESNFKDQCAAPRNGIDPATGNPYLDQAGSTTLENFWLRSWSNRTYLWFNEITDQNPANYSNRRTYFDLLKTTRTTASGTPVDQFHFTIPTDEYQQSVSSGASAGYGARFTIISGTPPREVRVAYTENTGPASQAPANLERGAEILTVDGVSVVNGNDTNTINSAIFPDNSGETHTFTVRDLGASTTRTFTMASAIVTSEPVLLTKTIDTPSGKVGYMLFNSFGSSIAEEALFDAITSLTGDNVTDFVLDLRYNGGGFLDIAGQLGYMIAGDTATAGRTFDKLTFNSKHPTVNPVTGQTITPTPFHNEGLGFSVTEGTALPSLDLPRVFILSTARTCSASEAVINGLRGIFNDVVLIGTRTCGKPYGFYATDNCGETYFTIQFRGENDQGFGDYADGFSPTINGDGIGESVTGCTVNDDFSKQLGDETENLLETALSYIDTGSCPAPPVASAKPQSQSFSAANDGSDELAIGQSERLKRRLFLEQRRLPRPARESVR